MYAGAARFMIRRGLRALDTGDIRPALSSYAEDAWPWRTTVIVRGRTADLDATLADRQPANLVDGANERPR